VIYSDWRPLQQHKQSFIRRMQSAIQLAILSLLATPALCVPQGLGVKWVDPGKEPPTVPSVWMYWGQFYYSDIGLWLTCIDDNGKEAYTPGGDDGWRLDSGCHLNLIDYDGIWIEKDPRPRDRTGCAYAFEDARCCGKFEPIELTFSGEYLTRDFAMFSDMAQVTVRPKSFLRMQEPPLPENPSVSAM
jgi:hypothetical protein